MSVVVHETSAEMCGRLSLGELRVTLSRLEAPQAAEELKELLFTMADSLSDSASPSSPACCHINAFFELHADVFSYVFKGVSALRSPLKSQQRRPAGVFITSPPVRTAQSFFHAGRRGGGRFSIRVKVQLSVFRVVKGNAPQQFPQG